MFIPILEFSSEQIFWEGLLGVSRGHYAQFRARAPVGIDPPSSLDFFEARTSFPGHFLGRESVEPAQKTPEEPGNPTKTAPKA